jgi:hypothetical protein
MDTSREMTNSVEVNYLVIMVMMRSYLTLPLNKHRAILLDLFVAGLDKFVMLPLLWIPTWAMDLFPLHLDKDLVMLLNYFLIL